MALKLGKFLDIGILSPTAGGVIGIDIGSSSLKIVQLSLGKNGASLETYGELQLGPYGGGDIGAPTQLDPSKLSAALSDIIRESNATAKTASLAVPHTASFIAIAPFPTLDHSQLPSMVPIEARKYVPMPMSEITLDWFVIPGIASDGAVPPTSTRVLMAAIHNESLKRLRSVVQNAGIAVIVNEIEPFCVIRSSVHEDDTSAMLIDFGASSTKSYFVESGILEETHRMPFGGHQLTTALSQALNIPYAQAEEEKRGGGISVAGPLADALLPSLDRALTDAGKSLERYEREKGKQISRIIVTGGGALLPGLIARTATVLGRDTHLADPFAKVEHPAFLEEILKDAGPTFSVALGIALRKLAS